MAKEEAVLPRFSQTSENTRRERTFRLHGIRPLATSWPPTLRTADATGAHAVLIKKHLWDFDETEVARPSSGAYERLPLVQIDDIELLEQLRRGGLKLYGCVGAVLSAAVSTASVAWYAS